MTKSLRYVSLIVVGLIIAQMILGDAFWHPNDYILMDGGDGYVIYFNAFFHVNYGSGTTLTAMNYPDPECIFMTDAQGVLAIILQWFGSIIPETKNYVVGAFHSLIIIGIVAQLLILFEVLKRFDIQPWLALIGAILIGSLAPQLVRISYGHLGLAYPFMIPLALLFLLVKRTDRRHASIATISIVTFMLFGFNNPYLLVVISLLILTYGCLEFATLKASRKEGLMKMAIAMGMLIILYAVMAILDPFDDRIHQQWGHFHFASTLSGILSGVHSLQYDLIISKITNWEFRGETLATISMASIIAIGISLIKKSILKFKNIKAPSTTNIEIKLLLGTTLIIFLYSSAMFHDKHWQMLISQFDFITMIKASGRLSWIPYYILSITGFIAINNLLKSSHFKYLGYAIMILWSYEGYRYINDHCKTILYVNHLTKSKLDEFITPISEEINLGEYQGILTIPVSQSWNDNLLTGNGWISEQAAYKIAATTGIPLINSRLSRAPVQRSLDNIQLTSNPLIRKELIPQLDPNKSILLAQSKNYITLSAGEQSLQSQSKLVYEDSDIKLYNYKPNNELSDRTRDSLATDCNTNNTWYYTNNFNTELDIEGLVGNGTYVDDEWHDLVTITIPDSLELQSFELSVWSKVNIDAHGMPTYNVKVIDTNQLQILDEYIDSRRSPDTQQGWLRTALNFNAGGNYKVVLRGYGRYKMSIDEVMIRPTNSNVCISDNNGLISINNYLID